MFNLIFMLLFSILLMVYGFVALFKKEWIWKLRSFSARLEGKDMMKRDEEHADKINRMGNRMAIIALILGTIAFVMNLATLFIMLNPTVSA